MLFYRIFYTWLLLLLFFSFVPQVFAIGDTSMRVMANRYNSVQTLEKPYLILISADGFRYSYLHDLSPSFLNSWDKQGITHAPLIPVFPSITFVNHYSIITGLYPGRHGIVNNFFRDQKTKRVFKMSSDSGWYKGIPLWSLAESQGMLSASMFWVGSEATDLLQPTYFYNYHNGFSPKQKVDKVINWLKLPEKQRPHFITLYFPEPDGSGHKFGTDSKEVASAVHSIDNALEYLLKQLETLDIKNVNIIFVSDHGMINVNQQNMLELPVVDSNDFDLWNSQTMATIYAKNPQVKIQQLVDSLRKTAPAYSVFSRSELPSYFHYQDTKNSQQRLGDIFLMPPAPKVFKTTHKISKGKHGYDPYKTPEMLAVFYAYGPNFKRKSLLKAFDNVEIYAVIAQVLGLNYDPKNIDGTVNIANKIVVKAIPANKK